MLKSGISQLVNWFGSIIHNDVKNFAQGCNALGKVHDDDVIFRIKKTLRRKSKVVYFNRLASYVGDHNEDRLAQVKIVPSFDEFMASYFTGHKAPFGVAREEYWDFCETALAGCIVIDL